MKRFIADMMSKGYKYNYTLGRANPKVYDKDKYYEKLRSGDTETLLHKIDMGVGEYITKHLYMYLQPHTEGASEPEIYDITEQ